MHRILLSVPVLLALGTLSAYAGARHDVPWYARHAVARQATVASCMADPGDLASSPDCVNAIDAARSVVAAQL